MNKIKVRHALMDIEDERHRQTQLKQAGKFLHACDDPHVDEGYKWGVLMEEIGEVAKARNEREGDARVREELIQVAAVACAWAESLDHERG